MPINEPFNSAEREAFERTFRARLEAARLACNGLVEDHRMKVAETLLAAGIHLIPCEHLQDHQFIVSQGVFDAAKKVGVR